jgi:hypothetical protein
VASRKASDAGVSPTFGEGDRFQLGFQAEMAGLEPRPLPGWMLLA